MGIKQSKREALLTPDLYEIFFNMKMKTKMFERQAKKSTK